MMKVYKLFRLRKDGTLGPLFIDARQRVPVGTWMQAKCVPTKGFKVREGWHATLVPSAPHLNSGPNSGRVWCLCEAGGNIQEHKRPLAQGGTWITASQLKVIEIVPDTTEG